MRAAAWVTVVLLAGCGPGPTSAASCAGPTASVSPRTAAAGDEVRVAGRYFTDGCRDTGQGGRDAAEQDVPVVLEQGGATWRLGSADATPDGFDLRVTVTVPAGVRPGPAHVRVGGARPVRVTLVDR